MLSHDDLQLTRRDTAIPALAELFDDEAAADIIRQAMPHLDVRAATGRYVRYKPGVSLLAAYLVDTPLGPQHVHVTAYRPGESEKLRKNYPRFTGVSVGDGDAARPAVDAARSLVVWPFPADDEIRAIPALHQQAPANSLWRRLAIETYLGPTPTWQIARYKPQRRLVAVGHADASPGGVLRLYGTANYGRARRAAKSLANHADDVLPGVIAHSDRHAALLMSWQPGDTLCELLRTAEPNVTEAAFVRAGKMLARLHASVAGKLPTRDLGVEAATLKQSAADLGQLSPSLHPLATRIATMCIESLHTGSAAPATLHGDLNLSQIVVDSHAARLIDLDSAAVGEAALDLGNLRAHLDREAETVGGGRLSEQLWNALLDGYAEIAPPPPERRLAPWTAAAWLRLAHEPFRRRHPDWHRETAAILYRACVAMETAPTPSAGGNRTSAIGEPTARRADALRQLSADQSFQFAAGALTTAEADACVSPLVREFLGDSSWQLTDIRLARHKPARRFLVEYSYRNDHGDETAVFGKVHVKPRHQRSLALQQELLDSGFSPDAVDRISVPAAVGVVPQWQMWLQRRVEGCDGWQLIASPDAPREAAWRISDAVVKLQQSSLAPKRVRTMADELSTLSDRYERLGRERPGYRQRLAELLLRCRELTSSLPDAPFAPAHGDFYPDQLRGSGDRLWVLDHDLFCCADVHLDVGNFVGHLHEYALREADSKESLYGVGESIIQRFLQRQPAATRLGVEVGVALTLARHVSISTQFEARRHATERILVECERRVASLQEAASGSVSP